MGWEEQSSTLGLFGLGVAATLSARYFKRKLMLRPFQASVIVAWPAYGVAIMHAVIDYSTPRNIKVLESSEDGSESARAARLATANLNQRLRQLAQDSRKEE